MHRATDQAQRLNTACTCSIVCLEHGIEDRLTKPSYPWINGQVERMNHTIKDTTVKRHHCGRRLQTLKGLTPYEAICRSWQSEPERFTVNPLPQMPGLNT